MKRAGDSNTSATDRTRATVFGAYGHTGHFVVTELLERGWTVVLAGRDRSRLMTAAQAHGGAEVRVADVNDAPSLDVAISGSSAVINCAGPFLDTAVPMIEAAIRSRVHYLDIAAEQQAVLEVFERFRADQRSAAIVIAPAMAFYGGLADLMATAAMRDWDSADEIHVAMALNSWNPTRGTRTTGQRNPGRRLFYADGRLERADPPPGRTWVFPAPFGEQQVVSHTFAETITISRHLRTPEIRAYMNVAPLADLRDPNTPPPAAADESGRSAQIFVMDVVVRRGRTERRVVARGRDIYAVTTDDRRKRRLALRHV